MSTRKLNSSCENCRASKVKCSGGTPCDRCRVRSSTCIYQPRKRRGKPRKRPAHPSPDAGLILPPSPSTCSLTPESEVVDFCIQNNFPLNFIEALKKEHVHDYNTAAQIKENELDQKFGKLSYRQLLLWRSKTKHLAHVSEMQCVQALQSLQNPNIVLPKGSSDTLTPFYNDFLGCTQQKKRRKVDHPVSSKVTIMKTLDWLLQFLNKINSISSEDFKTSNLSALEAEFQEIKASSITADDSVQHCVNVKQAIESIQSKTVSLISLEFSELKKCLEFENKQI